MHAVGHVIARFKDAKTGQLSEPVFEKKNLILFEGADIMSGLLSGRPGYAISHMYFQYRNTGDAFAINNPITRGDGRTAFDAIDGVDPVEDWLRVPIVATPQQVKVPDDSTDYEANGVWFVATSASSDTGKGESPAQNDFDSASNSKTFSVALVAAEKKGDNTFDRVFSRLNFDAPIELPPGKHLVIFWLIKFN